MISIVQSKQSISTNIKNLVSLSLLAAAMASMIPVTALGEDRPPAPDLFDDVDVQQSSRKALPKKALKGKTRSVHVHTDLLWSDTLTLNLLKDVTVTAVRDRLIDNVKGNTTWIGHVAGEQDSEVFLTVRGKTMSGNVQIGSDLYEIEAKGNNIHEIIKINPDITPPRDITKTIGHLKTADDQAKLRSLPTANLKAGATGTGTIIDLMVVYTPRARLNASGVAGIETKIANAVAMANQAYINSQIDMQLNVVYTGEINYVETGNTSTSLTNLTGTNDGQMDTVHALRNQYGADQVLLITADTSACGTAYVMQSVSTAFAPYAFSVVHDDSRYACLSNNSLAHELGHNQGNEHDIANSSNLGAYNYSHGYRLCLTGGFRTVMSYDCTGGTRISYFSNPNVFYNGLVTGSSTENNALSMTYTKATVAAFRSKLSATAPAAPTNMTSTALSASEISLNWSDNSSDETGFRLERSADGINWVEIAVMAGNTTGFVDSGLVSSTTYNYRVRAYNSNGNSNYSNIGTATTSTPAIINTDTTAPIVTISSPTNGSRVYGTVSINVTASDNSQVTSLKVFVDGRQVCSSNMSSMRCNWNSRTARLGYHTISSQATDSSNNVGKTSITVLR